MTIIVASIAAFGIGGIPFGYLITRAAGRGDIRSCGSGNIGATNVWRVSGAGPALLVFAGDIGKGAAAVALAGYLYRPEWPMSPENACLLIGLLAVTGHIFSPYLKFKGGKGVNTSLGVFVSLVPMEALIAVAVFVVFLLVFRIVSLGSIAAAVTFAALLWTEWLTMDGAVHGGYLVAGTLMAAIILITHRENIRRLVSGREERIHLPRISE
jgi:glycerol-3-phosphate acyltransferase PlsY